MQTQNRDRLCFVRRITESDPQVGTNGSRAGVWLAFAAFDFVAFLRGAFVNRCSCRFISTRLPRKVTPSICRRKRCSNPDSPGHLIAPPAPTMRCQGRPSDCRRTRATSRDAPDTLPPAPPIRSWPPCRKAPAGSPAESVVHHRARRHFCLYPVRQFLRRLLMRSQSDTTFHARD